MEPRVNKITDGTLYHLGIRVETAINFLLRGKNLFEPATPTRALRVLTEYRAAGKEFITGCDNETDEGLCGGHEKKSTSSAVKQWHNTIEGE